MLLLYLRRFVFASAPLLPRPEWHPADGGWRCVAAPTLVMLWHCSTAIARTLGCRPLGVVVNERVTTLEPVFAVDAQYIPELRFSPSDLITQLATMSTTNMEF